MIRSKSTAGACIAVLIACAGCSSGGSSDSSFSQDDFNVVVGQIVIPAVQLLNPYIGSALSAAQTAATAPPGAPSGTTNCPGGEDLSPTYCTSGTACRVDTPPSATTTFTNCLVEGGTLNGTWEVLGDRESNTSTLDLSVSVLGVVIQLDGTIDANTVGGNCTLEDLALNVTETAVTPSIVIDGLLTYCLDQDWPEGSRELTITTSSSDLLYQMIFNGTNEAQTTVKDASSGNVRATCTTNLDTTVSECEPA